MARRGKLEKFAQLLTYSHVFEMIRPGHGEVRQTADSTVSIKGKWHELAFKNDHPICVELACGRGEYTLGLAQLYPDKNFIGVDIKGARIHKGATIALRENIGNVAFLRIRIEMLELFFEPEEIDEIWITFPDPFPSKENRRLLAPMFLDKYFNLLKTGAKIHLKTDDKDLYDYSVETVQNDPRYAILFKSENISDIRNTKPELNILTYYEIQHLSDKKTIKYLEIEKFI